MEKIGIEPSVETTLSELEREKHKVTMELILAKLSNLQETQIDLKTQVLFIQQDMATANDIFNKNFELKSEVLKWMISFFLGTMVINVATIGVVMSFLGK